MPSSCKTEQGGCNINLTGTSAANTPGHTRLSYEKRDLQVTCVDKCTFLPEFVITKHLAMICGKNDRRCVCQPCALECRQDSANVTIDIPQTIEVIVNISHMVIFIHFAICPICKLLSHINYGRHRRRILAIQ